MMLGFSEIAERSSLGLEKAEKLCKLAELLAGVTPELTCERCASTASQVERLVGHRNFNAQFLSKRSTIDWACFLREAKNF